MKRKFGSIILVMLLCISSMPFISENSIVRAGPGGEDNIGLDYGYIYNITENLSNVIFYAPPDYEMQKGRGFGTEGERFAKDTIILPEMIEIFGADNVTVEQIEQTPNDLIDNKLEIINRGIKIDGTDEIECYISPKWTNTRPIDIRKIQLGIWPYDEYELNLNLNYTDLKVYRKPFAAWFYMVFTNTLIWEMITNTSLHNFTNIVNFMVSKIENYYGFSFDELNETNAPYLLPWYNDTIGKLTNDFVYIDENPGFNPYKFPGIIMKITPPYFPGAATFQFFRSFLSKFFWHFNSHCKGLILYDFNDDTYDMSMKTYMPLPTLYINKTKGKPIFDSARKLTPADSTISFWLEQQINTSIDSYNVIGQINGTDPSKTIIISSLYDGWWNQGTADSAIGMGIVLAIAKYMKELDDNGIKPKYTVKFIAFGSEEAGFNGARSYEARHNDEDIVAVLDINQVGFTQSWPPLTFNIFTNDIADLPRNYKKISIAQLIYEESNYVERTNGAEKLTTRCVTNIILNPIGAPSNDRPFAKNRTDDGCKTFCFLKDKGDNPRYRWVLHHRGGLDHTAGDVLDYYNWIDVNVTAEMIWNFSKYFAINPNCWFEEDVTFEATDSVDEDSYNDTISATMTINATLPQDLIRVEAKLIKPNSTAVIIKEIDYIITNSGLSKEISVTLPPTAQAGTYALLISLYNSTGRINKIYDGSGGSNDSDSSDWIYLTPRGNSKPNTPTTPQGETNIITGESYNYTTNTSDPEDDQVYYQWAWDYPNVINREIVGPYDSDDVINTTKIYCFWGDKQIRVRAVDEYDYDGIWTDEEDWSDWSEPLDINVKVFNNVVMSSNAYVSVVDESSQFYSNMYGGSEPYNYTWDFGDSSIGGFQLYEQNPVYIYEEIGDYTVNLTVRDNDDIVFYHENVVNVTSLYAEYNTSTIGCFEPFETIFFNDTSVVNDNYEIVNWTWNFGDGNVSYYGISNVSYIQNPNHTFYDIDDYNVSLTVTDNQSNSDTYYQIISTNVDMDPPKILDLTHDFRDIFGVLNVTIFGAIQDSSGVKNASVNIAFPDDTYGNFSMCHIVNNTYGYKFDITGHRGQFTCTIWTIDNENNSKISEEYVFSVPSLFGYTEIGSLCQSTNNRITGSVFTVNEYGTADSITRVHPVPEITVFPPGQPRMKCMIFRANDSQLIGTTEEKIGMASTFNFSEPKPVLVKDTEYILTIWGNNSNAQVYYDECDDERGRHYNLTYNDTWSPPIPWVNESRLYSIYCSYTPENIPPEITDVSADPDHVGFGFNVTISADVTDISGVDIVKVNIVKPQAFGEAAGYTMTNTVGDTYEYVFNDTWQNGQYNYTIYAVDNNGNSTTSSQYSFNVSAQANISVCTIKDSYTVEDKYINVTDPPGGRGSSSLPIGYELLDDNGILHMWNRFDSYYFNTSSGIQLTNHYDEFWSHNVLMLGYYNNDQWNLIYRTDELSGFNKNIDTDNETYVNATIWKDLTYNGYDFRLAIRYHLGVDDNELTVIPYIKNLGQMIPYTLGFAWEINDIQVDMTYEDDYIEINRTSFYLNDTVDVIFRNMTIPIYCWNETTNESYVCGYDPIPYFYIKEDKPGDRSESLYLIWNESLDYVIQVKSRDGEYNAPVTLAFKIGTLDAGQEKYTELLWHDASEITYYFNSYDEGEAWATSPGNMVDGSTATFASMSTCGDVELCTGNSIPPKTDLGTISKVELRTHGNYSGNQRTIILRPVFGGSQDGENHYFQTTTTAGWSSWFDITNDEGAPREWSWNDIDSLDCDVEDDPSQGDFQFTLYCSKVEVRVTYTSDTAPDISDPYPEDGGMGISLTPVLNITVSDPNGDSMNITWYSNSSGSWQAFGTNTGVSNGTYHQVFSNATMNGEWWFWKVNVTDGEETVESNVYKFYTGNQSKIVNTGSTNISGYLLMQVQFYQEEEWVVAHDTVDETSPRTINAGQQLALDTIFNGLVRTHDLEEFGSGTYRVYAAFRDPEGNILVTDDETELVATYEFEVTFE